MEGEKKLMSAQMMELKEMKVAEEKLKKKMMQLGEVHKMEQGCLGMLGKVLFASSGWT